MAAAEKWMERGWEQGSGGSLGWSAALAIVSNMPPGSETPYKLNTYINELPM